MSHRVPLGSIHSLPLTHPSGFVYVARFPSTPFPPGTLTNSPLAEISLSPSFSKLLGTWAPVPCRNLVDWIEYVYKVTANRGYWADALCCECLGWTSEHQGGRDGWKGTTG